MNFPSNIGKEVVKNLLTKQETPARSLGLERSWEGNSNWLQYSCLRNTVHRGATELQKSRAQQRLNQQQWESGIQDQRDIHQDIRVVTKIYTVTLFNMNQKLLDIQREIRKSDREI